MNVLFVCIANVGRSQVTEAYFKLVSRHDTTSAGTLADEMLTRAHLSSRKLKDSPKRRSVGYMSQYGVDISEHERTQLTPEMVAQADRVIVIAEKATWPEYLVESDRVVFWDIPDSLDLEDDKAHKIFDDVRLRVEELAREIG
jgi:protein-tyrosine-phosphatase